MVKLKTSSVVFVKVGPLDTKPLDQVIQIDSFTGSPAGLLAASQSFAREHFALKHRYAMVLHTDQPHPHVHLVVKAMSEDGVRLNIRKATLREWRREFARHLREHGIEANATDRAIRGVTEPRKLDGIYRSMRDRKRFSTHMQRRVESVAADLGRLHQGRAWQIEVGCYPERSGAGLAVGRRHLGERGSTRTRIASKTIC